MNNYDQMSRILRILRINKIEFPRIDAIFSNGEHRLINIKTVFQKAGIKEGDFGFELLQDKDLFNTVQLVSGALSWQKLSKEIKLPGTGNIKTFSFDLDPLTVYNNSELDPSKRDTYKVGQTIKNLRSRLNLSQDTLAQAIGSNKQYVSRIENDKSDIEFNTLNRIFEIGFDKKVCLTYYEENNFINTYSNSFFTNSFLVWIENNFSRLDLIEGIGEAIKKDFEKENITTTSSLAELPYENLKSILESNNRSIALCHFPETWAIQAKYLQHKDWFNLLKLQRMLKSNPGEKESSKLEIIAKKETRQELFEIG